MSKTKDDKYFKCLILNLYLLDLLLQVLITIVVTRRGGEPTSRSEVYAYLRSDNRQKLSDLLHLEIAAAMDDDLEDEGD